MSGIIKHPSKHNSYIYLIQNTYFSLSNLKEPLKPKLNNLTKRGKNAENNTNNTGACKYPNLSDVKENDKDKDTNAAPK